MQYLVAASYTDLRSAAFQTNLDGTEDDMLRETVPDNSKSDTSDED
jgi:hypothetical protein